MAIDTRDKRLSVVGYGLGLRPLPTPDGTTSAPERQSLAFAYAGTISHIAWADRATMFSLMMPWTRPVGPYPDGMLSAKDRQAIQGLYRGIAAASPSGSVIVIAHTIGRALARAIGRSL